MNYQNYMDSPEWQSKRNEALDFYGEVCNRCGAERGHKGFEGYIFLCVHHKTYKNLGNEPMEDLEVLCNECHDEEHDESVGPGYQLVNGEMVRVS